MLYLELRNHVVQAVQAVVAQHYPGASVEGSWGALKLEAPREVAHGDLATNAAMVLAKPLGVSPRVLADMFASAIANHPAIANVEIAGPGFLNIRLKPQVFLHLAQDILASPETYGNIDISAGRKALVEYVSINPTGPIHVGHGRNAVFGDAIARLLEKAGFEVWREYLLNDAGNQIRVLVRSLHARYLQQFGVEVEVPADGYPGEYLVDIAKQLCERDGDAWLHERDEQVLFQGLRPFAVDACLALIKNDIATLGIPFDRYFSEHEMHTQTTRMPDVVAILREKGLVYEGVLPPPKGKDVADYTPVELTLFRATAFGLPEDQAVYNRAGQPTYFGQDIAYHYDKLQRGYSLLATVIGVDQAGAFRPLAKAIEALTGRDDIYHPVPYEMVKVLRNGEPVKLSKRAGNIVLLADVLKEVGTDAFRFAMLVVKPTTPLTFDLAKAVEKSMENPVFYAQYAHARLAAVLRQAADLPLTEHHSGADHTISEAALHVLRTLMMYPAMLEQAATSLEPHRVADYVTTLAAAIHSWYGAEKWLDQDSLADTAQRLSIVRAAQVVLADGLSLCGVSAPQSM